MVFVRLAVPRGAVIRHEIKVPPRAEADFAPRIAPRIGCRPAPTRAKSQLKETLRYISAARQTADLFPPTKEVRGSSFEKAL
jgi:hypothetical protein